ncbi:MAG TPA: ABC transporter ATP-binding protein [Exilispira sp.]|nr:ABC transporter ATP-binding protein [Exilispira sp.]
MERLKVRDLKKSFKQKKKIVDAIKGISFDVKEGEIVGFLGPNGAGKTTTIKCICDLVRPDEGFIIINGFDSKDNQAKYFIGAVLEGSRNVYWRLNPLDNIILFAARKGIKLNLAKKRGIDLLGFFDLYEFKNMQVGSFSKGMQQKLAIACALIGNPKLLLLDEPTLGLDVETVEKMKEKIKMIAKLENISILLTSHQLDVVEEVSDRVIIINKGEIVEEGNIEDIKLKNNYDYYDYYECIIYFSDNIQPNELNEINDIKFKINSNYLELCCNDPEKLIEVITRLKIKYKFKILNLQKKETNLKDIFIKTIKS